MDPTTPPAASPARWRPALRAAWRLLLPALAMATLLAMVVAALGGAAVWLLRTEDGTRWLLGRLPGIEARGLHGALLSDRFAAEQLTLRWDGGRQSVAIEGLEGQGLRWSWRPQAFAWVGLDAELLRARRVQVDTGPRGPRPIVLPASMQWPLQLSVQQVQLGELTIDGIGPLREVRGRAMLGAERGREHRIDGLSFEHDRLHLQGSARIETQPPYRTQAEARLADRAVAERSAAAQSWSAEAQASGPLNQLALKVQLRGVAPAGRTAPALDLQAGLQLLEAWPLASLRATTQALDLQALHSRAPRTALSGSVELQSKALDAPFAAEVRLDNALAGRWSDQRLPVRRLEATVRTPSAAAERVELQHIELQLGSPGEDAGRLSGQGRWQGDALTFEARLEGLRPQHLDHRAAAMILTGPLSATLRGLPWPYAKAPAAASAPAATPRASPRTLTLNTQLEGRLDAAPNPVELAIDAVADERHIEIRQLRARTGAATAALQADAERVAGGDWQLRTQGQLADFDPLPWWPGTEGGAWRRGPHRLSSTWMLDLRVPARWRELPAVALLQSVAGSGTLKAHDSRLAGVPLALDLAMHHRPGEDGSAKGELTLAGNRLRFDASGDPLGPGRQDRIALNLQADALAALAPLVSLFPDLAEWAPRDGAATAELTLHGRWPEVRSEGRATVQRLHLGELSASEARASWQIDSAADQPLNVQADLAGVALGRQKLERMSGTLKGTLQEHRLTLQAATPLAPPRALETLLGLRAGSGTEVDLAGEGRWQGDSRTGGVWQGRLVRLALGPWDGKARPSAAASWVDARDVRAELRFDAQGDLRQARADAGSLRMADGMTLRWNAVNVDFSQARPSFGIQAEIEPFRLAPLLARSQPTYGWSGDLRLGARLDVRAGDKLDADVVFERVDGDLALVESGVTQAFGLTDLRVALNAHDGNWYATAAFAGRNLGEAAAALNLRPRPDQRWPTADTPIDGVIEGRVSNIGIWGTWVPPGWRLSGAVRTRASVSGRVGEPDYAGEVVGQDIGVRNLLQGVDVRGGDVRIVLKGPTARIDRFTAESGDGKLSIAGDAFLGEQPRLQLQLQAERFRVLGRVDRQLVASGQADLSMTAEQLRLTGKLKVDDGLFDLSRADAPSLDDDVSVRHGAQAEEKAVAPPPQRPRRDVQVAVDIDLGEKLHVRGRGLDTTLRGNLRVSSAAGRLRLNGIVNAHDGTYAAYGQKLEIERGMLAFSGEPDNPTLDVLALRPNLDVQVGVAISGSLRAPRVRLYAGSDMSETDKISWLVLGRASDGLGRADTALLQRAAVALLAGEGEAPTDSLLRTLGLDELSLRQGEGEVRETVITLGKQLSRRWYVGYERGVNATTGTWQLIYRIAQRFTLRAQSGHENSLDIIWVWRLQDSPPEAVTKSGNPP